MYVLAQIYISLYASPGLPIIKGSPNQEREREIYPNKFPWESPNSLQPSSTADVPLFESSPWVRNSRRRGWDQPGEPSVQDARNVVPDIAQNGQLPPHPCTPAPVVLAAKVLTTALITQAQGNQGNCGSYKSATLQNNNMIGDFNCLQPHKFGDSDKPSWDRYLTKRNWDEARSCSCWWHGQQLKGPTLLGGRVTMKQMSMLVT